MSRRSGKSQAAVERLLEERRQYEGWIRKVSEPGSSGMAPHVVDRVRSDYRNRLDDVTRQLARHEKELEANLAELEQRRDEMRTQRALREEALAEVRLRHTVGEFDDGQYTELSADHTAFIAQLAEELETTERDIARLEEVLGLVSGVIPGAEPEPAPGEPAPAPEPSAASEPLAPPTRARHSGEVSEPTIAPEPAPPPPRVSSVDELAFIRSVAAAAPQEAPPAAAPVASEPPPPAEAPPPPASAVEAPPAADGGLGDPVQHIVLGEPDDAAAPTSKPTHMASRSSERTARPHERPSEADASAKTLRCAECGTNNLPTEWYCEKCGAELSAF
jgi:hypothetical protein